ncbi:MAG: hypothetical protein ACI4RC_06105 [Oscillospiraceae bacterium]
MKKILKKITAMSCAMIMAASMAIGASAATPSNTYDLYITSCRGTTCKSCKAGTSRQNGKITTTVKLNGVSKNAGITYTTRVGGIFVGSHCKITKKGSYVQAYTNDRIRKNKTITVTVSLAPASSTFNSTANGSVYGK